jgi:hypothetical protein
MVQDDKGEWVRYSEVIKMRSGETMSESIIVKLASGEEHLIPEDHQFRIGPQSVLFVFDKEGKFVTAYAPHAWVSYSLFPHN